jgi:hypothetical protein
MKIKHKPCGEIFLIVTIQFATKKQLKDLTCIYIFESHVTNYVKNVCSLLNFLDFATIVYN